MDAVLSINEDAAPITPDEQARRVAAALGRHYAEMARVAEVNVGATKNALGFPLGREGMAPPPNIGPAHKRPQATPIRPGDGGSGGEARPRVRVKAGRVA